MEEFCNEDYSDEDLDISDEDVTESEILSDNQPPSRSQKQCHVSLRKLLELLTTAQSLTNNGLKSMDVSNQLGMTLALLFATSLSPASTREKLI